MIDQHFGGSGVRSSAKSARSTRRTILAVAALAGLAQTARVSAATVTDTYTGPASGTYSTATNWSLGVAPNNGTNSNDYNVIIDANAAQNSTVALDISPTIDNLTVNTGDALTFNNGTSLNFVGNGTAATISGGGSVNINSAGSFTDLLIGAPTLTITNTTLTLAGAARIRDNFSSTPTLNNSTGIIQGQTSTSGGGGSLGNNDTTIINGGTIDANSNGNSLLVDPSSAGGLTNTGLIEATGGGALLLSGYGGGAFTNTGGTISAATGSTVDLVSGGSVSGGVLSTAGTGQILVSGGGSSISGLTNSGTLNIQNNASLGLSGTIINNGTLNIQSTGNFTDLLLNGDTTLAGTGTVTIAAAARVRNNAPGNATLTIGAGQTIQGETSSDGGGGTLGNNDISIVNNGVIDANSNGNSMIVDPAQTAVGLTNNNLLEATNGSTLILSGYGGGTFTNTGASVNAATGSIVLLTSSAAIVGGTLNAVGTGVFQVNSGGVALTGLTKNGTLNLLNSSNLTLSGTITNNGALNIQSTADNFTDLFINGNTTLAGTGTVTLIEAARIRNGGPGTPILTIGSGQTISGETSSSGGGGTFGNNDIDLVNNGIINANSNGNGLYVDPSADAGLVNNNLIEATNGGILELSGYGGGGFTNTNATITAATGSQVQLLNSASITGGTVSAIGTGTIYITGGGSSLNSLTKIGQLIIPNSASLTLSGTITNTGDISVQSSADNFTDLFISGNVSLTGTGTITLEQAARVRSAGGPASLTIGANQTVQGETSSNGGGGVFGNNDIEIINNGTINANSPGNTMVVDPVSDTVGLTNNNVLEVTNGGILNLSGNGGGSFNNSTTATITAGASSTVVLSSGAIINGGALNSVGSGASAGTFLVTGGGSSLNTLTNNAPVIVQNNANLSLSGTIINNGSINVQSTANYTDLFIVGNTTLSGTGTLQLSSAARLRNGGPSAPLLTIGVGQTIMGESTSNGGGGTLGNNDVSFFNQGTVNANVSGQTLDVDPASVTNAFVNDTTGLVEASNGGIALLNGYGGGAFTNNGTFEALDGSSLLVSQGYLTNFSGTTLTGGIYKAIATATTATINLDYNTTPSPITINAADVTLSGAGSTFAEINTLATNNGEFRLLNNRSFTTVGNFTNSGLLQLGGGTFDVASASTLTNATGGTIQGFGTVNPRPINSGTVEATGGALTLNNGVGSTGTVQIDAAASLNLSGGTQNSSTNYLAQNGTLALGAHTVVVNNDYTNANFGSGNSFNPHANVTGTGQIQAAGNTAQGISVNGGAVQTSAIVPVALGNIHVGGSASVTFAIANTGTSGPVLRGALQTSVNGGNITAGAVTGTGATAGNYGPLALGASTSSYTLAYTGMTAGALTGQVIHVESNFDNVPAQNITVSGAAYRLAAPSVSPTTVNFGIVHVGDTLSKAITISNTDPADGFSESLDAAAGAATGSASITGSVTGIAANSNNSTSIVTGISTLTAGVKTGTASISLSSDGSGSSGLGITALTAQTINLSATVDNYASAFLTQLAGSGSLIEVNPELYTLNLGSAPEGAADPYADLGAENNVAGPADTLAGSFGAVGSAFSLSSNGAFTGIAAGQTYDGPDVYLSTAAVGPYSSSFTFTPRSQNTSGYDQALSTITVDVSGTITTAVPEPGSVGLLITAGCLSLRRRNRSAHSCTPRK